MSKPFKNIDKQISILGDERNLDFNSIDFAKTYLLHNNYYDTINRYKRFFIDDLTKPDNFNHAKFEYIVSVHNFDRKLKKLLLNSLIDVEKHFKSIIVHRFCENYGEDLTAYLKMNSYKSSCEDDDKEIKELIRKFKKIIKNNINSDDTNSIKHYYNNNNGIIPLWVVSNYITLGHLVYFYRYLHDTVKNKVNRDLSYFVNDNNGKVTNFINSNTIQLTIENIAITRNISAHNNILLGNIFKNDLPFNNDIHGKFNIKNTDTRKDLFNVLISLQYFLDYKEIQKLYIEIYHLIQELQKELEKKHFDKVINSIGFNKFNSSYKPYNTILNRLFIRWRKYKKITH